MELIKTWGLTDNIVVLVFDTTASNSGINIGAAKLIEEKLDKKLFYLACRHHISEVKYEEIPFIMFNFYNVKENTISPVP